MRRLHSVLLALPLVLAGCGGGTSSSGSESDSSTSSAPSNSTASDTAVVGEDPYGGGGGGGSSTDTGASGDVAGTITISGFAYGDPLSVTPGALIRVVNEDSAQHSVTAVDGSSFDTGLLAPNQELTFNAPATAGTYAITCTNHSDMSGQLIVSA